MNQKKIGLNIRIFSPFAVLFFSLFLFYSCGQSAEDKVRQNQLDEVKQSVNEDLVALRGDVENRMERINQELEGAEQQTAEQLSNAHSELENQLERLNEEMQAVENATIENWDEVVARVSQTATDVRSRTIEITQEVNQLLEPQ